VTTPNTGVDFINAPPGQTEGYFQALFTSRWGSAAGTAYAQYNAGHPQDSAYVNAQAFADLIALEGLQKALDDAGTGVGTAANQVVTGAEKGAIQVEKSLNPLTGLAAIGDFFQRLTQASTWVRIAEGLLGLGLVIVGLAHLASGTAVGRAAAKAGKAAMLL